MRVSIGGCIHDLEIIAKAGEAEDLLTSFSALTTFDVSLKVDIFTRSFQKISKL